MIHCTLQATVEHLQSSPHRGPMVDRVGSLEVRQGRNGRLVLEIGTDAGLFASVVLDEVAAERLIESLESPEENDQ